MDQQPTEPILQFFTGAHIIEDGTEILEAPKVREVTEPFCAFAIHVIRTLPRNPERTVALRKLLEAKDAAVRALLFK